MKTRQTSTKVPAEVVSNAVKAAQRPYKGKKTTTELNEEIKKKNNELRNLRDTQAMLKRQNEDMRNSIVKKDREIENCDLQIDKLVKESLRMTQNAKNPADPDDVIADGLEGISIAARDWAKKYACSLKDVHPASWSDWYLKLKAQNDAFATDISDDMLYLIMQCSVPPYPVIEAIINHDVYRYAIGNPLRFATELNQDGQCFKDIGWLLSMTDKDLVAQTQLRMKIMKILNSVGLPSCTSHTQLEVDELKNTYIGNLVAAMIDKLQPLLRPLEKDDLIIRRDALKSIISRSFEMSCRLAQQPMLLGLKFSKQLQQYTYREGHDKLERHRACKLDSTDSEATTKSTRKKYKIVMAVRPMIMRCDLTETIPCTMATERLLLEALVWIVETPNTDTSKTLVIAASNADVLDTARVESSKVPEPSNENEDTSSSNNIDSHCPIQYVFGESQEKSPLGSGTSQISDRANQAGSVQHQDPSFMKSYENFMQEGTLSTTESRLTSLENSRAATPVKDQASDKEPTVQKEGLPSANENFGKGRKRSYTENDDEGFDRDAKRNTKLEIMESQAVEPHHQWELRFDV